MAKQRTAQPYSLRRSVTAEKLMELGNISAGALLFWQAFSGFLFDFGLATLGLATLAWLYVTGWWLLKRGDDHDTD